MKNFLLFLLFVSGGAYAQVQKSEIEKASMKSYPARNKKTKNKKHHYHTGKKKTTGADNADKNSRRKNNNTDESIVVYEKNYYVRYGVYLFMNHKINEDEYPEALALREL
ncbi:hypothetical protein F3J23_03645 [Chryseobacterium sp. Tr-659]|uniref:hypothetical protein n=1 Tax=Chryseobacterium sp. Tr-659 TaxID=2608340 RepID=UPI00141EEEAE|nr:hypothetical protein [Chryseobacterium sp. Tr-659]NIF04525.1 hypothetical protein [Chryseobacterium sp. Tr-659]